MVFWASSSNSIAVDTTVISGVTRAPLWGIRRRPHLDIFAPRPAGHRSTRTSKAGWDGDNHNRLLTLTNATILDYDLIPQQQSSFPTVEAGRNCRLPATSRLTVSRAAGITTTAQWGRRRL